MDPALIGGQMPRRVCLAAGLAALTPQATARASPGAAAIEAALIDFSAALARPDTNRIAALTTPDFVLLDEGRFYDVAAVNRSITEALANATMTRAPYAFNIRTHGPVAWANYRVRVAFNGAALAFLESAVLVRRRGAWRIAMMATQMERP